MRGGAGNRVRLRLVDGEDIPERRPRLRVESDETAVERPDVHLAMVEGHTSIHDVAADGARAGARHLGIVGPQDLSGPSVEGIDNAPLDRGVDHPVHDERGGFEPAMGAELVAPDQTQLLDILLVDLLQLTESLLFVASAVQAPVGGLIDRLGRMR
jgi:hypothetical protein